MVQKFYRRRSKLKPEDWTEEIEKWEKYYLNNEYLIRQTKIWYEHEMREKERKERNIMLKIIRDIKREKEEKQLLKDYDGRYCGHRHKMQINGTKICYHCGLELGKCYAVSVGYKFKNHVMRGRKKC